MRVQKILIITIAVFAISVGLAFAGDQAPWFVEPMNNSEAVLAPGTTTFCDNSFTVENMGKEQAEVHVIMGNGDNYYWDQLGPNAKKAYSLAPDSPFATASGKSVQIDEARIVNATAGDSKLKIECKK